MSAARGNSSSELRVAKNTAILIFLRAGVPLLSVVLILVLSRMLGTEGVGRYALAYSFLYLFNTLGPLGLYEIITREAARDPSVLERMLANSFILGTASSLVLMTAMFGLGVILEYDIDTRQALAILSLAILPYTIGNFLEGACVALERIELIAAATIAEYVFKVGVGITLLYLGYGLDAVLLVAVVGRVLASVICACLLRSAGISIRWAWDHDMVRKLLKLAPTFVLIAVFATLYWRIDIIMLSKLRPMEDVGYYGAAYKLFEFALVAPTSLCLALYPRITALIANDLSALAKLGRAAFRYLFALTLPIAVAVSLAAETMLKLVYGETFGNAALTLAVLMWTLVPYNLVRYHAYVLIAADRQRIDLLLNVIMSLVNVLLNLLLIPSFGHLGAAFATLVAICIYASIQYVYIRVRLPGHAAHVSIPPAVLLASAAVGLAIWASLNISVMLAIAVAPVVYVATLVYGGFFSRSELALLHMDHVLDKVKLRPRPRR